jgi:hypothetical protein
MEISAYNVRKLAATAHHTGNSHWLELTITERFGAADAPKTSTIVLFAASKNQDGAALVDRYAAAISAVGEVIGVAEAAGGISSATAEEEVAV